MSVPKELKYTSEHEWIKIDGNIAAIGITDYAQGELGDIVYVELPAVGDPIKKGEAFGNIEAVKAVSDLYSPVSGKIAEVNDSLTEKPEIINSDPYEAGWMVKIKFEDESELGDLLDAASYEELI